METTVPILIGLTAVVLLGLGAILDDRRARVRRRVQREQPLLALPLLHSINDDRCIGCEACIDVCPTEVLDLVEHKVRVSRFSDCVQCEQCANACPTQALVMYREGTTPRMLTVPELDEHFQTGVPGQYLIGEVAGKPLVKNAANLGRAVIEHIARELASRQAAGDHGRAAGRARDVTDVMDVLIVGSGPGGLSAGLACIKHRLSCLVLEKEHVISSTVSRYPKGKHFMAEPCTSQNVSYLPVFDGTKEELVAAWTQVIEGVKLPIRLGEAVETVQRGDDGVFTIKSTVGTYRARTVVLATGLRGKPRLLVVPGANLEKVQPLLDDPAEFAGEAVLVVGGGDSAVEGAIALAEVGATVTLSYRGDGFKRCKQANQKRLAEMTAGRRLTVLLESNVKCFTPDSVTITLADKSETVIANQRAFVLIGADTPVAWLETNHVRFVERPHLYALGSSEDVVRRFAPEAAECPRTPDAALAILLDRPVPRSPARRMRSVVDHLRDELREVVTSVSSAFRLTDLEPPRDQRRAMTHTPARGVGSIGAGRAGRASSQGIPASRLATGRPATAATAHGGAIRPGVFGAEQTVSGPPPILPRSARRRTGAVGDATSPQPAVGGDRTTDAVPSLRALERTAGLASRPLPWRTAEMASLRRSLDERTDETASRRAHEQQTRQIEQLRRAGAGQPGRPDDGKTEEVASLRALERSPDPDAASDAVTEEMRSLRTLERTTAADQLSLRALGGPFDAEATPLHTLDQTLVIGPASSDRSASVMTSATRPAPLRVQRPAAGAVPPRVPERPSAVPPPVPQLAPRFARGSEGIANPPPMLSEPHRAPTAGRRAVIPAADPAPSLLTSATRPVAVPVRAGSAPPPLPQRPSRLPRGSSLVRQRLTPTPTLTRRQPGSAAPVEATHDGGGPAARPTRGTR